MYPLIIAFKLDMSIGLKQTFQPEKEYDRPIT